MDVSVLGGLNEQRAGDYDNASLYVLGSKISLLPNQPDAPANVFIQMKVSPARKGATNTYRRWGEGVLTQG